MDKTNSVWIKEICAIGDIANKEPFKISPVGMVTGIDGRTFNINGEGVLKDLQKNGLKIVLNVDHGETDKYGSEAAGWFTNFSSQDDGIYAKLKLNALGKKLLENQSYKYLSPEYLTDEFRNVASLVGVGLVNQPNLLNQALNNQHHQKNEEPHEEKNKKGEQDMKEALGKVTAELNKLKEENKTLQQQIADHASQARAQKVDNAIKSGVLIPAKKDFALSLDANALDTFLKVEGEHKTHKEDNSLNPDALDDDASNDIFKQLDIE